MFSTIRNTLFQYVYMRNNTLFQDKFNGFVSLFHTIFAPFLPRHLMHLLMSSFTPPLVFL